MTGAERDIQFQIPVEIRIAWTLARQCEGFILPNGNGRNAEKDFEILQRLKVEVKCDYKAKQTRNIYLEVYNSYRKQDSGLKATKADRWAHYIPGDAVFYTYNPRRMLSWLEGQDTYPLLTRCGDNNSDGYIVPIIVIGQMTAWVKQYSLMA